MPILMFVAWMAIILAWPALAHDSWISQGGHRNAAGEWCCSTGDCFVIPEERVLQQGEWYILIGEDGQIWETIPVTEAQPSPDGQYWRCKRPDGSRRCFFAPPPST